MLDIAFLRKKFEIEGIHRKIPNINKCLCGSGMTFYKNWWVCKRELYGLLRELKKDISKYRKMRENILK